MKVFKPLLWLTGMILFIGFACSMPTSKPVDKKQPEAQTEEKATLPKQNEEPTKTNGAIDSIQDIKKAVIQIKAQGTFIDPKFGYQANVAGMGSGFIIDPSGLALTNNHVVTGAALLKVWIGGDKSKTYNAKIVAVSECSDMALIDIDGDGFPYLDWRAGDTPVGLEVYAAGYPLGDPEFTLTKGIVSKEHANGETNWASVDSVIEHDATINPGNSGGPLVDKDGHIVGINYAAYKAADQYFAIGKDLAQQLLQELKKGSDVESIGVNGVAVVSDDKSLSGVWVSSVKSGSPADKAGLKGGDIILKIENLNLATDGSMADYCDILRTHDPSKDTLSIDVMRWVDKKILSGQLNGKALETAATLPDDNQEDTGKNDNNTNNTHTSQGESGELIEVFDDTKAIGTKVPASWNETDGSLWEGDWGDLHFVAARIMASPDLEKFKSTYKVPGVIFSASRDWGKIGGYVQLLDGTKHWYEDDCKFLKRMDFSDEVYEGKTDTWGCGGNTMLVVVAVRPIKDPLAFLALIQIQVTTKENAAALIDILSSFDVVGNLP